MSIDEAMAEYHDLILDYVRAVEDQLDDKELYWMQIRVENYNKECLATYGAEWYGLLLFRLDCAREYLKHGAW